MSEEKFMKEVKDFKKVEDLHYFLMNASGLILFKGFYYCSCKRFEEKKCTLCRIPTISTDFKKKLDYITDNAVFLKAYHEKLVPYLVEIFDTDNLAIDFFLNDGQVYSGRDRQEQWRKVVSNFERIH